MRHTGASIESGKRAKPGAKLSRAAPAELRRLRACAAVQDWPFADRSPGKDQESFSDGRARR